MKFSIPVKFLVILVTALALMVTLVSTAGIVQSINANLYTQTIEEWTRERVGESANDFAIEVLERTAIQQHSNATEEELSNLGVYLGGRTYFNYLEREDYSCVVRNEKGETVFTQGTLAEGMVFTVDGNVGYPLIVRRGLTEAELQNLPEELGDLRFRQSEDGIWFAVRDMISQEYSAEVTVDPDAVLEMRGTSVFMMKILYDLRYIMIVTLLAGLLVFAIGAVYLCWAAGRAAGREEIRPGGLNRMPLDLYLAAGTGLVLLLLFPVVYLVEDWFYRQENFNAGTITVVLSLLTADAVIFVGFCFACAAQFKAKEHFWWRHSILGFFCGKLGKAVKWVFRGVRKAVRKTVELLPLTWRWMLLAAGMGFWIVIGVIVAFDFRTPFFLLLVLLACLAVTFYGAYAFGALRAGAKRMAEGKLDTQIDTKYLIGEYALCAKDLNALAEVAVEAAKKQMKADRMKTELITNVSHDIKTPLTSIINYVDLLEKPHTEQEGQQYLEVLHRQSQQMKKLVEDLMELSKASTGNLQVEIGKVDPVEAVNQALGEFADKLAQVQLMPIFRHPSKPVEIRADGRLVWRVLANLLGNAVKYALPGTRLYVEVTEQEDCVAISMKNISREELNVSAEELTERFVRGDASRNTEGSGLGLNIARSLMELQKGQLELLVDGDLFKVTLLFRKG